MNTPFNPAEWIEQFKAVGGGFVSNGDSMHFCWTFAGPPLADNIEARRLYREIAFDGNKRAAVEDMIGGSALVEAQS